MNNTRTTDTNETYRDHYPVIAPLIMCNGVGDGKTTACVMEDIEEAWPAVQEVYDAAWICASDFRYS